MKSAMQQFTEMKLLNIISINLSSVTKTNKKQTTGDKCKFKHAIHPFAIYRNINSLLFLKK